MSSDEHGRPGADGSADWAGWAGGGDIVVPDDIRELDTDIRAYHRERRSLARRSLARRLLFRTRFGVTLPVVLGALVLAAIYSIVMLVVSSPRAQSPRAVPLARPIANPGRIGALLPDTSIRDSSGRARRLRALRPAVLLLTPPTCDCAAAARTAARAAEQNRLKLSLIGTDLPARPAGLSASLVDLYLEPDGELLSTYHVVTRPLLVLVGANGVVQQEQTDVPSPGQLDTEVRQLLTQAN